MLSKIFNKYTKVEDIISNSNIKTYSARIEPIIKEITAKDYNECYLIKEKLEKNKNGIYEIIEDNNKIYIVIENNPDTILKIDKLILQNENISNEPEYSVIGTSHIIEEANSLIPGEIYNFPMTENTNVLMNPEEFTNISMNLGETAKAQINQGEITNDSMNPGEIANAQITPGEITNDSMNPGEITNALNNIQTLNGPIIDHELSKPQENTSIPNKIHENYISSDNKILSTPEQTPSSFITQDNNPSYNSPPEITIPSNDNNIYGMPISSDEPNYLNHNYSVEQTSTNNLFNIENVSNNPFNSNPKEMPVIQTPSIQKMPINPISYIEETNDSFNLNLESINPPPAVTAPPPISLVSSFQNPESKLPPPDAPEIKSSSVGPSGFLSSLHRRTIGYFKDEDFKRGRPIYNDFIKFNDDRYRGFRLNYFNKN